MNNKLRTALITVITLVWAANFTVALFKPAYKPPAEVNLPFMAVVGVLTATYQKNNSNGGKGKDDK